MSSRDNSEAKEAFDVVVGFGGDEVEAGKIGEERDKKDISDKDTAIEGEILDDRVEEDDTTFKFAKGSREDLISVDGPADKNTKVCGRRVELEFGHGSVLEK